MSDCCGAAVVPNSNPKLFKGRWLQQTVSSYGRIQCLKSLERYFTFCCAGLKDSATCSRLLTTTKPLNKRNYVSGSQNPTHLISETGNFLARSGREQSPALSQHLSCGVQPGLPPSLTLLLPAPARGSEAYGPAYFLVRGGLQPQAACAGPYGGIVGRACSLDHSL